MVGENSISFNGAPSQEFSPVEEAEIGSGVFVVQRDETKAPPFVRGNNRFSLFKWFKRGNRDSTSIGKRRRRVSNKIKLNGQNPSSSSTESIDTFYSTTTVRSFDFHSGTIQRCNGLILDFPKQLPDVGPFGAGAVKLFEKGNNSSNIINHTLPNTFSRKRDITERYSLQPSSSFNSCGNIPVPVDKSNKSGGSLKGKKVHVKGKRRAPNPPDFKSKSISNSNAEQATSKTGRRRRRPAPRPPEKSNLKLETTTDGMDYGIQNDQGSCSVISNDTLILRGGVLLPKKENKNASECIVKVSNANPRGGTISDVELSQSKEISQSLSSAGTLGRAMPRPWYKRASDSSTARRGDVLRNSISIEKREESGLSASAFPSFPFEGSLSKLNFFHRTERNSQERRREAKRKSGISILTNISELDKEAAAIVQEEQARAKASTFLQNSRFIDLEGKVAVNEELVQDMVATAIETSPRRSTRALISKFNAISSITKVTVNANFFTKNSPTGERSNKFDLNDRIRGHQSKNDWLNDTRSGQQNKKDKQSIQYEQDLSRNFLLQQRSPKLSSRFNQVKINSIENDNNNSIDSDIPDKSVNQDENSSSSNKLPSLKVPLIENTNEPSNSFKADRIEKVAKQRQHSDINGTTDNENTKICLSSYYKVPVEKNVESPTMIKKLDMIFDEIDQQLRHNKDKNATKEIQACASNQVTKMLDFLKESETIAKGTNSIYQSKDKTFGKKQVSGLINSEGKQASVLMNTEEDPVTVDLKEILKEMKHSLPKRSKSKKPIKIDSNITNVSNEPFTSAFTTNLKKNNLEKSEVVSPSRKKSTLEMRGDERQKVSSAVQTIGNVRKVNNLPSTSTSMQNTKQDIIFTSVKIDHDEAPKLIRNKFHLIRPKDFAEIEAIKMVKKTCQENTYANVIQVAFPLKPVLSIQSSELLLKNEEMKINKHLLSSRLDQREKLILSGNQSQEDHFEDFQKKNMNTLAVNKLLKKLEAAIASGNHQQAAMLAKELAQLKIHCSVIRQRAANAQVNVNMYIEDKEAHQGPIPLLLPLNMTVSQLKAKIYVEFEIPTNIQRWIIGKNLADNEDATLEELQTTEGEDLFLYLVAPDLTPDDVSQPEKSNVVEKVEKLYIEEVNLSLGATITSEVEEKERTSEEIKLGRYEELMSLENCDLIPNSEPIECPICFVTYGSHEGITLRDCLHTYCRPCLINTIQYCEEAEVKCPFRDNIYTCESVLQEREIKALVSPEVYQQHLAKSITQAENNAGNDAFHCKTPDCPGWCLFDDNVNNFLCPVCRMTNCLTCQVIHMGQNCRQYQEEVRLSKETDHESKRTAAMLEEMVDRGEALPCPTCAVVLMKKWGCDWLRCSMCKTEICWITRGPRWGPGGKGDTTGGCKCGENGVKCHPRCNYCH